MSRAKRHERGEDPRVRRVVYLDPDIAEALDILARRNGRSFSSVVGQCTWWAIMAAHRQGGCLPSAIRDEPIILNLTHEAAADVEAAAKEEGCTVAALIWQLAQLGAATCRGVAARRLADAPPVSETPQ